MSEETDSFSDEELKALSWLSHLKDLGTPYSYFPGKEDLPFESNWSFLYLKALGETGRALEVVETLGFFTSCTDLLIGTLEWTSYLLMKGSFLRPSYHSLFIWEIEFVLAGET